VQLGFTIPHDQALKYKAKYPKSKMVSYICGCPYIMDSEHVIYNRDDVEVKQYIRRKELSHIDQTWIIPQNAESSLEYSKIFYESENATVVPFVWDPIISDNYLKINNLNEYSLYKPIEKVAIMEPNLSIIKNSLIPLLICENHVQRGGELKFVHLVCADKMGANKKLNHVIKGTKLMKQKKISVEHRYATLGFLNRHADVIVCFQMGNPLNYLYLDATWRGWPVVHNAHLCQDLGYYYPEFCLQQGSDQLRKVIEEHPVDVTFKERMQDKMKRYTYMSPRLLADYKQLFENVMADKFQPYEYIWETNSIKKKDSI
jgi:hypothetical protein